MNKVIVLFEVTIKNGRKDDYLQFAQELKASLSKADGFISAERFLSLSNPNKLLSMSIGEDEESVSKWRNFSQHRKAQIQGRQFDFEEYKITIVTPIKTYTMATQKQAPQDSNAYFRN
ncbi:antibiotic biosynthesis monooxygenase family protein [Limosilactobacillus albertensis]|uniref:Antibiotic biosynthesis monooxygenase n=1 Tax=Limosilactobacillus albertensis TaxID=2759752 RepID=A0A839HAD4_9LACO|nr:antibiotic biosynthesis monooxygenase family protein [Limosilactobacillus albertensis]MBB1124128.1 antibiotic biosynthesis monooxygenase [Limosilactobacillus albertensis]MCD7122084.1 antibiotic biosynthesis monooxygenase [Limosilactobacillus albertensis]